MNKTELAEAVAESAGLTRQEAMKAVDAMFDTITTALRQGEQVAITGFGTFLAKLRAARKGRNPRTGEEIEIKEAKVAQFKAGKGLKDAVNA